MILISLNDSNFVPRKAAKIIKRIKVSLGGYGKGKN